MEWLGTAGLSVLWLLALIVFLIAEAVTVGLASIWFAAGALAALIVSFITGKMWIQILVFLAVSLGTLLAVRPLVKNFMPAHGHGEATNADRVIGAEGVVLEDINNLKAQGQVAVNGTVWTARSDSEKPIDKGATVQILRIEGVKVIVTMLAEATIYQKEGE